MIHTLLLTETNRLTATPNATEWMLIREEIDKFPQSKKNLVGEGSLQIVTSHRGSILYLENGATLYRNTAGANGYMYEPTKGIESCYIGHNGLMFQCDVEFI